MDKQFINISPTTFLIKKSFLKHTYIIIATSTQHNGTIQWNNDNRNDNSHNKSENDNNKSQKLEHCGVKIMFNITIIITTEENEHSLKHPTIKMSLLNNPAVHLFQTKCWLWNDDDDFIIGWHN